MRPNFSNTLLNRAKVYLSLGNTAAAIRDYEDVLRLKPDNEEARSALATLRGATPPQMGPSAANSLCGAPGCN
jgi:tetratricopeptide (TPR) repeat protein